MSIREYESANVIPPLENHGSMKSQANLLVSTASGLYWGLSGLFGGALQDGHYLTLQADGTTIYVKFAAHGNNCIDQDATGTSENVAWPIPDGATLHVVPVAGHIVGTGVATLTRFDFLHARVQSGAVATGYLRLYRSSLAPNQDVRELRGP